MTCPKHFNHTDKQGEGERKKRGKKTTPTAHIQTHLRASFHFGQGHTITVATAVYQILQG